MNKTQQQIQKVETRKKLLRDEILMLKAKEFRITAKREGLQRQLDQLQTSGGVMNRAIGER